MSGGFRSWLGGVIGYFWSTPFIPASAGFDTVDARRFPIVFQDRTFNMQYNRQIVSVQEDSRSFPIQFIRKGLPIMDVERKLK